MERPGLLSSDFLQWLGGEMVAHDCAERIYDILTNIPPSTLQAPCQSDNSPITE
jgi:hypothetical protein